MLDIIKQGVYIINNENRSFIIMKDINKKKLNDVFSSLEHFKESFKLGGFIIHPQVLHFTREFQAKTNTKPLRFHTHRTYELSMLLGGESVYHFKNKDVSIVPGDLAIIPCDCRHALTFARNSLVASLMLFISYPGEGTRTKITDLHKSIEQHAYYIKSFKEYELFLSLIIEEALRPALGWEYSIQYMTRMLYINVFRKLLPEMESAHIHHNQPPQRGNTEQMVIEQVRFFIQDNFFRWVEVKEISNHIGLSQTCLNRIFKKHKSSTVSKYVLNFRMDQIQKMLQETDRPLKDIAETFGFNDFSHFCRVFKKEKGMTPSEFRRLVD